MKCTHVCVLASAFLLITQISAAFAAQQSSSAQTAPAQQTSSVQNYDEQLAQGVMYHDNAPETDDGTLDKAMSLLKPLIDRNMTARAYYGSSLTKQASYIAKKKSYKVAFAVI